MGRRSRYSTLGTWISVDFWDALLEKYIGGACGVLGVGAEAVWAEGRVLAFEDDVDLTQPESLGTATGAVREGDQPE